MQYHTPQILVVNLELILKSNVTKIYTCINDDVVYIQIVCIYFFYHGNTTSVMIHWLQEKKVYKHTFIRTIGELFDFQ